MELIKDGEEVKSDWKFDQKVGFELVEKEPNYGEYVCKGILGKKEQNIHIIFDIGKNL